MVVHVLQESVQAKSEHFVTVSILISTRCRLKLDGPTCDNLYSMSKVPGTYYFEYSTGFIPSAPPFTTWSGLLIVEPDSDYAERLLKKCGGTVMKEPRVNKLKELDGKNVKDENGNEILQSFGSEGWISGFWTAPEDWTEMAAGREDMKPYSK